MHRRTGKCARVIGGSMALCALATAMAGAQTVVLDPVVVTATRTESRAFDVPASIDTIDGAAIRNAQPMVNLSESLVRVPGITALNRNNYAQDLQITSRGFGGRAQFGVRGVRLYQDDIPATAPDGQGQTGSFSLLSAQRIEVLRGPFSVLYGNASGGVIAVFTEDGTDTPVGEGVGSAGSYGAWTAGAKVLGSAGIGRYVAAASRFEWQGYREHSWAQRDLINAKATLESASGTRITVIGSQQTQPDSADPLGLTREQWEADPRQAVPAAFLFDTRKTIHQLQGGATVDQRLNGDWSMRVTGYYGNRTVRQYLALLGDGPTASGGVVDLDRDYGGVDARAVWKGALAGGASTLTFGGLWERQSEHRLGYVNDFGEIGALRRDEDDVVTASAGYAEFQWDFLPRWSLTAGVRVNGTHFDSTDHYVTAQNPDDSGSRDFGSTTPVAALLYRAADNVNLYASYGQGFETPTFAELAYRPGGTGLNFALDSATSQAFEAGAKMRFGDAHRVNAAGFYTRTKDEIVVDTSTGGRTTYKNAGRTKRYGAEFLWDGTYSGGWSSHVALTWLVAEFDETFTSGSPPAAVPAGNKIPGVPGSSAYGEIVYAPPSVPGLSFGAEVQYQGKIYVNDRNSDAAPAYTIGNLRVIYAREIGAPTPMVPGGVKLSAYARLNNVGNLDYVGSVIVGDTNGRFFEPAQMRNWVAGLALDARF